LSAKQAISNRHGIEVVTHEKPPDTPWIDACDVVTDQKAENGSVEGFADVDEAYEYYLSRLAAEGA
jgi:hypothetical protein